MATRRGLDYQGLKDHLTPHLEAIVKDLLPEGKKEGDRIVAGSISGEAGTSLDFHLTRGVWRDWAEGEDKPAGDIIDLYAAVKGIQTGEAYKALADEYGYEAPAKKRKAPPRLPPKDFPAMTVPENAPDPPDSDDGRWFYRDRQGRTLFVVVRTNKPGGAKDLRPWRWNEVTSKWVCKGWPAPRPLYDLHILDRFPKRAVVLVEGEKVVDHLVKLAPPGHVITTWCGGCGQARQADLSPLAGRTVVLVPDCDEPGDKAMRSIAERLIKQGCQVNVARFRGKPEGWDLADHHWLDWEHVAAAIRKALVKPIEDWLAPAPLDPVEGPPPPAASAAPGEPDLPPDPPFDPDQEPPKWGTLRSIQGGKSWGSAAPALAEEPSLQATTWAELDLQLNGDGRPYANENNAYRIIAKIPELADHVWYDEFYDDELTDWPDGKARQIRDQDLHPMLRFIQSEINIPSMKLATVRGSVLDWAHGHPRNAPREWLKGLEWDGENRIAGFLTCALGVPATQYSLQVSRNFWLGLAARMAWPGCKCDNMLILEGDQGDGKTQALEIIGGDWYTDTKYRVGTLDFYQCMAGKALICLDELDSFRDVAQSTLKNVLSCCVDRYRASYDRKPYDRPRHCVFVGTTNKDAYLEDETGNRRYWPVRCNTIDLKYTEKWRDQLFAEAYHRVAVNKEPWYHIDLSDSTAEQEARRVIDPWEEPISQWLFMHQRTEAPIQEIAKECIGLELSKIGKVEGRRIGKCLRALGFVNKTVRKGGRTTRVWTTRTGRPYLGSVGQVQMPVDEPVL